MKNVFRAAIFSSLLTAVAPSLHAQTSPPAFAATGLAVGETAPLFRAKDAVGREVNLQQLLKKGPVVLYFYRGQWCPFCNKQLSQLQDSLQ